MAIINIPTPLRKIASNQKSASISGKTVDEVIRNFADENPDISEHLYDKDGNLRKFMRIYIGDTDIKSLENTDTPLTDDSEINIIPAIAGGSISI